jgi:hypothetical protein
MTAVLTGSIAALSMISGLLLTAQVAQFLFAQPPDIAQQTAAFCVRLVPGVLPQVLPLLCSLQYSASKSDRPSVPRYLLCLPLCVCAMQILGLLLLKVLQAQNEMLAPAMLGISAFLVNIGTNFIFIRAYGFLGAPIATTLSRILFFIGSVAILARSVYCRRKQRDEGGRLITCSSNGKVKPCYTLASSDDEEESNPQLANQADVPESRSLTAAPRDTCEAHDVLISTYPLGSGAHSVCSILCSAMAASMAAVHQMDIHSELPEAGNSRGFNGYIGGREL